MITSPPVAAGVGLLASIVLLLGVALSRRNRAVLREVPGPFLASFSTLWQIYHVLKGHGDLEILELHRRHGDFVRISHREVSSSHPDTMDAILRATHKKGDWYQALAVPDKHHNTPMSELDPKRHRERSVITQGAYSLSWLMRSEAAIDSCILLFREQLLKLSRQAKPIHLDYWLNYLAFDVIGELTFSSSFGFLREGKDVGNSIKNIRFLMLYQALMGYMYWMHDVLLASPFSGMLGLRPMHHVFDTAKGAVDRRSTVETDTPDMISLWRRNIEKNPGYMQEKEIMAVAGMTIIAGSETMTGALGSVVYYLLKHPAVHKKLRQEIDQAEHEKRLSLAIKHEESKNLPYLQAVIKETLRHFPPVPFNLPRVAPKEGLRIGDQHFPEGTIISISPLAFHMNPAIFGTDAHMFKPERWLDSDTDSRLSRYLCSFGAGYNGCPGRQFAIAEMSKVVAVLIRDFDIELVDQNKPWKFRNQFTVVQSDWPVFLKAREKVMAT